MAVHTNDVDFCERFRQEFENGQDATFRFTTETTNSFNQSGPRLITSFSVVSEDWTSRGIVVNPNRKAAVKPGTTTESGGTLFVKEWENYTKATMMEIHIEGTDITITFFAGGVLIVGVFLGTLLPSFAALGLGNDFNRVTCLLS